MNKAYSRINWENYPSDATPLNEANLNKLDSATDTIDDRVITLDTTKATKTEVAKLVADVTFEESTEKRMVQRLRSTRRWRKSPSTLTMTRPHSRSYLL